MQDNSVNDSSNPSIHNYHETREGGVIEIGDVRISIEKIKQHGRKVRLHIESRQKPRYFARSDERQLTEGSSHGRNQNRGELPSNG